MILTDKGTRKEKEKPNQKNIKMGSNNNSLNLPLSSIHNNNTFNNTNIINSSASYMKNTASFNQMISKQQPLKSPIIEKEDKVQFPEDTFCVYDPYKKQDFESEIITKGERIYMKNLAEKNLKLILEEKERKMKQKRNEEGLSFKPSLQMTAYYKTNNYNKTNHLVETTCFKSKNIY